ncbi:head GIN domain-containing protein [Winogradskyella maritima]|uniref:Head GIN domain-containing protein n=1 Tax=Winogradskyella maritima TaxID=1517766 RepID=A0ABV8AIF0_9FLAO|nr:head GIN domain-containing protein [Winogradskyella maritima]
MNTLIKLITATLLSMMLHSCQFDMNINTGVSGNGTVVTETREINSDFNRISVSRGLDVYITQSNIPNLEVEADENLHDIITTEVEGNTLRISASDNIRRSKAQIVRVNVKDLEEIKATSGSDVFSETVLVYDDLILKATGGADLNVEVKTKNLECRSTSGSDLIVRGTTVNLIAEATSGSDINAKDLKAEDSKVSATSGSDIRVHSSNSLSASATSGADVRYYGNPTTVKKSDNSLGSVRKQ